MSPVYHGVAAVAGEADLEQPIDETDSPEKAFHCHVNHVGLLTCGLTEIKFENRKIRLVLENRY